jgi:hypothetical protein
MRNLLNGYGEKEDNLVVFVRNSKFVGGKEVLQLVFLDQPLFCRWSSGPILASEVFETVDSLHDLGLDDPDRVWWNRRAVSLPAITDKCIDRRETSVFPQLGRPFKPGDIISIIAPELCVPGKIGKGYVHSTQAGHQGADRIYFVYGLDELDHKMFTLVPIDIDGPQLVWLTEPRPKMSELWWVQHAEFHLARPEHRLKFLHFPTPQHGWAAGHIVSVPDEDDRVCAKILRTFLAEVDGVQQCMYQVRRPVSCLCACLALSLVSCRSSFLMVP